MKRLKKTTDIDQEVFSLLCDAAASGAPCPSIRGLGRQIGVSEYAVSRSFSRLQERSMVVISVDGPFRRRVAVPGSGVTDWSVTGNHFSCRGSRRPEQPMQLLPPSDSPWTGDCFAAHNIEPGDGVGSVSRPATLVPTVGVLA